MTKPNRFLKFRQSALQIMRFVDDGAIDAAKNAATELGFNVAAEFEAEDAEDHFLEDVLRSTVALVLGAPGRHCTWRVGNENWVLKSHKAIIAHVQEIMGKRAIKRRKRNGNLRAITAKSIPKSGELKKLCLIDEKTIRDLAYEICDKDLEFAKAWRALEGAKGRPKKLIEPHI